MSPHIEKGLDGFPVLLADTPAPKPAAAEPSAWQSGQWDRRSDAIRDFAREFEPFNAKDIKDLVNARTNRSLTDDELDKFLADVREQQLADFIDILDQYEQGKLRARRQVTVRAPRGYTKKIINHLTEIELKRADERLRARGWDDKTILTGLYGRLSITRQRQRTLGTSTP